MKKLKHICSILGNVLIILLIIYIIGYLFFPSQTSKVFGYRFYSVLTDSMDPVIPPGSLVLSKAITDKKDLKPGDIVTFRANRFGDNLIFTHYLRKIEKDETGQLRYFTQGNTAEDYDAYTTYRSDILGRYVFHVPYVGRVIEFLRSPYGMIEIGIISVLLLIQSILGNYFDNQDRLTVQFEVAKKMQLRKVRIKLKDSNVTIQGRLLNRSENPVNPCRMQVDLLDKWNEIIESQEVCLAEIPPKGYCVFKIESGFGKELEDYKVIVTAEKPGISELEALVISENEDSAISEPKELVKAETEAEVPQEIQSESNE